jgi:tRNA/tmRNA/rRNA uracil-C5-methylase (TrmA/RlmC/RlmD family)
VFNVFSQNAFLVKHGLKSDDLAKIEPFVKSPIIDGYRNKCEFSFGQHPFTGEMTVGFRLASYRKGSLAVVGVDHLPNVSDKVKILQVTNLLFVQQH